MKVPMADVEYHKLNSEIKKLSHDCHGSVVDIGILSNLIVAPLEKFLTYTLAVEGIKSCVHLGEFDDLLNSSKDWSNFKATVVFWDFLNIHSEGLGALEGKSEYYLNELANDIASQLQLCINNLHGNSLILINRFTSTVYDSLNYQSNKSRYICGLLNDFLETIETENDNIILFEIDSVLSNISLKNAVSWKFHYNFFAPYTIDFFRQYTDNVAPLLFSIVGATRKVLVLDCDNTLWKGSVGEDGLEGIDLDPNSPYGRVFLEIQKLCLDLHSNGVLLCVASKNNPEDVQLVFDKHSDMLLSNEHIILKKINWELKSNNLMEITSELNVSPGSVVFLDDSEFEIGEVRSRCFGLTVKKVPDDIFEYGTFFRSQISPLFYRRSISDEDRVKTEMYKHEIIRKNDASKHESHIEYFNIVETNY